MTGFQKPPGLTSSSFWEYLSLSRLSCDEIHFLAMKREKKGRTVEKVVFQIHESSLRKERDGQRQGPRSFRAVGEETASPQHSRGGRHLHWALVICLMGGPRQGLSGLVKRRHQKVLHVLGPPWSSSSSSQFRLFMTFSTMAFYYP